MYRIAHYMVLGAIKENLGLDKCIYFSYGAAPLKMSTVEYFASLDIPLFNLYGMSEMTGPSSMQTFAKWNFDSAGYNFDGCETKIADPDESGEGEICMRGRNIMMGYLKNEEATKAAID